MNIENNSLILNLDVQNDLIFSFKENYSYLDLFIILKEHLKKIFYLNNFKLTNKDLEFFYPLINFIIENLNDNTIKSKKDLKFYILNDLELTINNNEYLFKKFFNNSYKEINNKYLFKNIE